MEQQNQELEERVLKLIEEKEGQCTKTDVARKRITENSKSAQALLQSMVSGGLLVEETLPAPGRVDINKQFINRSNELCALCNSCMSCNSLDAHNDFSINKYCWLKLIN